MGQQTFEFLQEKDTIFIAEKTLLREVCTIFYRFSIDFRLPSPANHQSTITLHFSIRHIQEARNAISKLDIPL